MRLIDAEAAKNLAEEFYPFVEGCAEVRDVKDFLNCCSTIEAKPVVHAHWKEYWDYNCMNYSYCCTNCEKDALTKEETMYDQVLTKFCPFCGAQMDEVVE